MWTHVVWTWNCFRLTPLTSAAKFLNNFRFTQYGFTTLIIKQTDILLLKIWRIYRSVSYLFSCTSCEYCNLKGIRANRSSVQSWIWYEIYFSCKSSGIKANQICSYDKRSKIQDSIIMKLILYSNEISFLLKIYSCALF